MHIIDDEKVSSKYRFPLDICLNKNHFLPPVDHVRFLFKPEFGLAHLFAMMTEKTGKEIPIGKSSIRNLCSSNGVGKRAEKKVESFFGDFVEKHGLSELEKKALDSLDNFPLCNGNAWIGICEGLKKNEYTEKDLYPVLRFLDRRISQEQELMRLLQSVFGDEARYKDFLKIECCPESIEFQKKNTLKPDWCIDFTENRKRDNTPFCENQVEKVMLAFLHDAGDFYLSLLANLDISMNIISKPFNARISKTEMKSFLKPLFSDFIENKSKKRFLSSFIDSLKKTIGYNFESRSYRELSKSVVIDACDHEKSTEDYEESQWCTFNKWRSGKTNPSPDTLLKFYMKLKSELYDEFFDEEDIHIIEYIHIHLVWSIDHILNLMLSHEIPDKKTKRYFPIEKRRAVLCKFLDHYPAHWDYWLDQHYS